MLEELLAITECFKVHMSNANVKAWHRISADTANMREDDYDLDPDNCE